MKNNIFAGSSEIAHLMRTINWSETPLGPVEGWPQSLGTCLNILLTSPHPMSLWWGPNLVHFYNDEYRLVLGGSAAESPQYQEWKAPDQPPHPLFLEVPAQDEKMLGRSVKEVFPELVASGYYQLLDQVYESGQPISREEVRTWKSYRKSGDLEEGYLNLSYQPIFDANGSTSGVLLNAFDVTEQVRARLQVEETEKRFSAIINQATAGIAQVDFSGRFVFVNRRYCEIVGYSQEELLGKKMQDITHPEDLPGNMVLMHRLMDEGRSFKLEKRYIRKDGALVWVNNNVSLVDGSEGVPPTVLAVTVDVTAKKEAEAARNYQQSLLEALQEVSPLGILVVSPAGKMLTSNQRFQEMWNLNSDTLETDSDEEALDFVSRQFVDPEAFLGRVAECYQKRLASRDLLHLKDGRIIARYGSPVAGTEGTPYGYVWFFQDVTKREKAAATLQQTQEQLQLALSAGSIGTWIWDIANDRVLTDRVMAHFYGVNPEKASTEGLPLEQFLNAIHDEDIERVQLLVNQAIESGEDFLADYRVTGADGKLRWVVISGKVYRDAEGRAVRFPGTMIDISERKEMEEALRQSEQRFKVYAEAMPQMAFIADAKGEITYYNERWYRYVGGVENTEGWGWKEQLVHHPDDLQRTIERWTHSLETGEPYEIEYRLRRYDGEFRWHLGRAVPVENDEGEIELWLGTNTDIHEQKNIQEDLQRVKEQLTVTFQNVPSGIVLFDSSGKVLMANKLGAQLQGYSSVDELLALKNIDKLRKRFHESFVVGDDQGNPVDPERSVVSRAMNGEMSPEDTFCFSRENSNEERCILAKATPVLDQAGAVDMVLLSITDITQQKKAQEALRKSEEYYKSMTDNTPVMTWISGTDGKTSFLNKSWYEYSGQTPETALGVGWLEVVHPDDRERCARMAVVATQQQAPFSLELRLLGKDGKYRWHMDSALPRFDGQGDFEGYIGAVVDIHDRKVAEEELVRSKENLALAVQVSDLGTAELWPQTGEMYWSDRCKELFGLPPDVALSFETFLDAVHPEDRKEVNHIVEEALQPGQETKIELEFRTHGKAGEEGRWLRAKGQTYLDEAGQVRRLLATVLDITTEKEAEEALSQSHERLQKQVEERTRELVQANDSLQRSNAELNSFAYVASHDLKAPLRGISTIANWLEEDYAETLDESGNEHLKLLQQRVKRMYSLIDDILQYSRAGRKMNPEMEEVDVNNLVEEVKESLQVPPHFHIVVSRQLPKVRFEFVKLFQVFQNLISNAIKFNDKAEGKVQIEAEEREEDFLFTVSDNGRGIAEQHNEKVFELFQAIGKDEDGENTGLGLAIIKKIIEYAGGRIWLESEEGKGTTFFFTILKDPNKALVEHE